MNNPQPVPPFQFTLRWLLGLTAIVSIILGLGSAILKLRPKPDRGPVEASSEWPKAVQELLAATSKAGVNVEPMRVFCIFKSADERYYWEMKSSPELLALVTTLWTLKPATKNEVATFRACLPVEWIAPVPISSTQYLANHGHGGDNYIVMTVSAAGSLCVYYNYDF